MAFEGRRWSLARAGITPMLLLSVFAVCSACGSFPLLPPATPFPQQRWAEEAPDSHRSRPPLPPPQLSPGEPTDQPEGRLVTIPAGARIEVVLDEGLSAASARRGDFFHATLASSVIIGGKAVLPEGAPLMGLIAEVQPESPWEVEDGRVSLVLDRILVESTAVLLRTEPLTVKPKSVKETIGERVVAVALGVAGLLVGEKIRCGNERYCGEVPIGGYIGAAAVTYPYLVSQVKPVVLAPNTTLNFNLTRAVRVPVK